MGNSRDWYAEWLLGEVARIDPVAPNVRHWKGEWWVGREAGRRRYGATMAEALAALYRDLTGTEPPLRPTEEEVRAWVKAATYNGFTFLRTMRDAAASDDPSERMMARAVVEGV